MGGYISYFYKQTENEKESNETETNESKTNNNDNIEETLIIDKESEFETENDTKTKIEETLIIEKENVIDEQIKEEKIQRKYLWKKQKKDTRDKHNYFCLNINKDSVDLRSYCPKVYSQGTIGSCTANAICGAYEYDYMKNQRKKNKQSIFSPSRLFLYYNERSMENTVGTDSGAEIRDGMKSINKVGVCSEKEWPYDTSKFTDKPSESCYKDAIKHESIMYGSLKQTLEQLKSSLLSGYPFVFGFLVYKSFESDAVAKTGIMTMPTNNDTQLGGHAVMAVGFDDSKQVFIIRNSWGEKWGDKGYFYMPYEYIKDTNLCSDFWVMKTVI